MGKIKFTVKSAAKTTGSGNIGIRTSITSGAVQRLPPKLFV